MYMLPAMFVKLWCGGYIRLWLLPVYDKTSTTVWFRGHAELVILAGELESESSITSVAGEKLRQVQAAAKQQQALASGLIKAGELAYIYRPLAYVMALRMLGPLSCVLLTKLAVCQ